MDALAEGVGALWSTPRHRGVLTADARRFDFE